MRRLSKIALFLVLAPYNTIAMSVGTIDVINAQTIDGNTVLRKAIVNQNYNMVRMLLEYKANPNPANKYSPLEYAIESNQEEIALLLLEKGTNCEDSELKKRLIKSCFNMGHAKVLQCLIKKPEDLDLYPTLLHECMRKGWGKDFIKGLITNCHPDLTIKNKKGSTLLHHAVTLRWKDMAEFLIDLKADVNAVDNVGRTPLHYAAMYDPAIVSLLLDKGANKELLDEKRRSALYYAVKANSTEIVELLIGNETAGK